MIQTVLLLLLALACGKDMVVGEVTHLGSEDHVDGTESQFRGIGSIAKNTFSKSRKLKDTRCVLCQFYIESFMAQSGPAMAFPTFPTFTSPQPRSSFLELQAPRSRSHHRRPRARPPAVLEQEKIEIDNVYRVIDTMMDTMCEVSTSPLYYDLVCEKLYAKQELISQLIVNRRTPVEVCNTISMCGRHTYTYRAKHSAHRFKHALSKPILNKLD